VRRYLYRQHCSAAPTLETKKEISAGARAMLDDPQQHRAALRRARVRRYRQRQRNGGAVLRVEVADYFGLLEALIDAGLISEAESADRRLVEITIGEELTDLALWHKERNA
jgi:hypothetical protein